MNPAPESAPKAPPRISFVKCLISLVLWVWAGMLLLALAAALIGYLVYDHVTRTGHQGPLTEITIPKGTTGYAVGELLEDQGFIEHEGFFRLAIKLDKRKLPIQAGRYQLHQGASALDLLHQLQEGPNQQLDANRFRITIPEGLSIQQMADLTDDPEGFRKAAADPALLKDAGVDAKTLEGFLMPDTYFFDEAPAPETLVKRMLEQFNKEYQRLCAAIPGAAEYDRKAIITVASLVEEEARLDEERPKVAAVLYNRLDKKMPLQMDSTLQYALGKYGQRMIHEDKEVDSPYNTYKYLGLPPGPISSPGAASIAAALQPANVNYLYFVSNADGKTHTFSATMKEHERAVARYRREIAVQRHQQ